MNGAGLERVNSIVINRGSSLLKAGLTIVMLNKWLFGKKCEWWWKKSVNPEG